MRLRDAAVVVLFIVGADPAAGQSPSGLARPIGFGNEPSWSLASRSSDQARLTIPGAAAATYRGHTALAAPAAQVESARLEGTTWRLTNLPGNQAPNLAALPRRPTLRFAEGRVTGFTGCNVVTGTYTTKGTSVTLSLGTTLMACPEPGLSIERAFGEALKGPLAYAVKANRLTLTTASGAVLQFEPEPAMTLEGHTWNVTDVNNGRQAVVSLLPDTKITLSFEKGTVSGSAGCNTFHATYSAKGNGIKIGPPASTRMACAEPVMVQERAFLAALAAVTRWTIDGGMLDMHRADGERALMAKPVDAK